MPGMNADLLNSFEFFYNNEQEYMLKLLDVAQTTHLCCQMYYFEL